MSLTQNEIQKNQKRIQKEQSKPSTNYQQTLLPMLYDQHKQLQNDKNDLILDHAINKSKQTEQIIDDEKNINYIYRTPNMKKKSQFPLPTIQTSSASKSDPDPNAAPTPNDPLLYTSTSPVKPHNLNIIFNKPDLQASKSHLNMNTNPITNIPDIKRHKSAPDRSTPKNSKYNIGNDDWISMDPSKRIDAALGMYYKDMNPNLVYYKQNDDDKTSGKFIAWFNDNGCDDDDIATELADDATYDDCTYTDFDPDFPIHASIRNAVEIEKEKFRILKHCYDHGYCKHIQCGIDPLAPLKFTPDFPKTYLQNDLEHILDFNVSPVIMQLTTMKYKQQCDYAFGKKIATDTGFHYSLALCVNNNHFPVLQYIVDIYQRYRLQRATGWDDNGYKDWCRKIIQFSSDNKINDHIADGINIYRRLCPFMRIIPLKYINDNLYHISNYFYIANQVINEINNKQNHSYPYQFDVGIICNSTWTPSIMIADDDDDDTDGTDDDKDDYIHRDLIGNIYRKVNGNKLINYRLSVNTIRKPDDNKSFQYINKWQKSKLVNAMKDKYGIDINDNDKWNYPQFSFLNDLKAQKQKNVCYNELCNSIGKLMLIQLKKIIETICVDLCVDLILYHICDYQIDVNDILNMLCNMLDENKDKLDMNTADYFENQYKELILNGYKTFSGLHADKDATFPKQKRFIMMVDRRTKTYENNNNNYIYGDEVIFYDPPKGTDTVQVLSKHKKNNSNSILPELYVNNLQKCLIPRIGYNDKKQQQNEYLDMDPDPQNIIKTSTITCGTSCGSNLLIFSFHIISSYVTKCYLWRDGQCIRFFPQDIYQILPKIFNDNLKINKQFKNDKNIDELIRKINFVDREFDYWCSNNSN